MAQIKKDTSLRKAILQAAITGQLISSVEGTTETGKELLDKIIEERNKKLLNEWEEALKKNPKAKKPAPVVASVIDEEEIPFDIPENWCWCRLGELSESIQYGYNAPAKESGRIKMVRITDIQNGKVQWATVPFCEISEEEIKTYRLRKNDILFARTGGTVGKSFLVDEEPEDAVFAGYLIRTQYDSQKLNPKYMKMFMESQLYWDQLKNGTIATAQPNCNGQTLSKMILPLPPLAVQNAIVAKLEQVLPLVDAYENALLQKEELKSTLGDKVKKAILQEAITGQLTEGWRKSATIKESGKQLLDRIIEERNAKALAEWEEALKKNPKAKKPVAVVASEIEEEEIPFEVPESWCWCRWGELSYSIQYGYNAPAKENGRIKMVRITDIQNGKVQWDTVPYCDISDEEIITYKLKKNDILFARTGGTVGKSFLVDEEPENAVYAGYLIRTQYDAKKLNPKYMKMFMESQLYWEQLKNGTIATAQPNCNGQTLSKMILPLPPMEEQDEIVKKVEELLPLCK